MERSHSGHIRAAAPPSTAILLLLLFLVSFLNYLDRNMLGILMPAIKADLELTDAQLGFISGTAFSVLYVLMGIPFGRLADRYSPRRVIAGALAFWSAMTAACGLAQGFGQLVAARVLVGLGEAGASPAANVLIAAHVPAHRRARALSLFALGLPAGIFVGFLAGGALAQTIGWRATLVLFGLPGIALAAVVLLALPEREQTSASITPVRRVLGALLAKPTFRHLCMGSALFTLAWQGMIVWLPSYFTRSYGLELSEVGAKLAVVLTASLVFGLLAGGFAADSLARRDVRWTLWLCAAASIMPIPLYGLIFAGQNATTDFLLLLPALAVGLLQGVPALSSIHAVTAQEDRGVAVATYFAFVNLVSGCGPLLIGAISDQLSLSQGPDALGLAIMAVAIPFGAWSALHFWLASRRMNEELVNA